MAEIILQNTTTETVNTTTEVINNLQNSEMELQELNQQVASLREEYKAVVNNFDNPSFFNFDNVYFWFVIAGLLLLVFGLWWWLLEMKKDHKVKTAEKVIEPEPVVNLPVAEVKSKTVKAKVIKVKVRKLKKSGD